MTLIKPIVACMAVLCLVSCKYKDLYEANLAATKKAAEQMQSYKCNFIKAFGQVAYGQSWDFSSADTRVGTRDAEGQISVELCRGLDFGIDDQQMASDPNVVTERTITKNLELYSVLTNELKDGVSRKGESGMLLAPNTEFTIYPLCMKSALTHDLYVRVGEGDPVKVYSKTWTTCGRETVNGDVTSIRYIMSRDDYYPAERAQLPGVRIQAPIGTRVEIYLDNIGGKKGNTAGTGNGKAVYLDTDAKPEGVKLANDAVVKYIGIEDDTTADSDQDYNDVVLAVVGSPFVPEEIALSNGSYDVPLAVTKRYMIEDLGTTDDFDFNDVVVDVTQTVVAHHQVMLENGLVKKDEVMGSELKQKATVRHLGGILPFQLTIGNTTLPQLGSPATFGADVELEYGITGWNPADNNISISVNDARLSFPKAGAIPMIIACDNDVAWSAERVRFDWKKFLLVK